MNAADLFRVVDGDPRAGRETVVLVHGSWTDHSTWQLARPLLAEDHVVATYDRRGHSRSGPADGRGARRVHEDDLIEIVERLGHGPVHLAGNSYGGSIALAVAARRPDLVRSVTAHEPPLVGVVDHSHLVPDELSELLATVVAVVEDVGERIRAGDAEIGARRFVEELVLGRGMWDALPPELRSSMVANAPSFLEMLGDPDWGALPIVRDDVPLLLTAGAASPRWLVATTEAIRRRLPRARRHTFADAGHAPQLTHPVEYADVVRRFVEESTRLDVHPSVELATR